MNLQKTLTVPVPDWLKTPEIKAIFAALQDENQPPQILCVGGCVRNLLLGLSPGDIDLATVHLPDETIRRLNEAGIDTAPTGIDHGTITAIIHKKPFEITTLRKDIETDGRHAVVGFTTDWEIDAMRRDFTMNTLLMDDAGNIYDPLRSGIKDLEDKKVRFVGDPGQRLQEDVLRLLRFFRFHALYGSGAPDAEALAACRAAAPNLARLSRERITQEFFKILMVGNPVQTVSWMADEAIMPDLITADRKWVPGLTHVIALQTTLGFPAVEGRLAVLLSGQPQATDILDRYFVLSRQQKKQMDLLLNPPTGEVKAILYRHGRPAGVQLLILNHAQTTQDFNTEDQEIIQNWQIPSFPISGADLKSMGIDEGPTMGKILEDVEEWWIHQNFTPDRKSCLAQANLFRLQYI
jgi:poly(A) polymerase